MLDLTLPTEPTESRWEWPASSRVPEPVRRQIEAAHTEPAQRARLETENAEMRSANARLEQQIARQDQRLVRLERGITMLRVELYGGSVKQLRDAGITVKAGNEPADGKIQPLHEKLVDGLAQGFGQAIRAERQEIGKKLAELTERVGSGMRFKGVHEAGATYEAGDVCVRSGSSWIALTRTADVPGEGATGWSMLTKRGRDGRDARDLREQREPVVR